MASVRAICSLVSSGVIKKISYSYEPAENSNDDCLYFHPIVGGDGWEYSPNSIEINGVDTSFVPIEVVKVFQTPTFFERIKLLGYNFSWINQDFFDRIFYLLEKRGYEVKRWCNPEKSKYCTNHSELIVV